MDTKLDRELVKYLAAFVDAEDVFKRYEVEEEEVNMCTMLNKMISDGEARGKAEDILVLLGKLGVVPGKLRERIMGEKNLDILRRWFELSFNAKSIEQFQEMM